jgi:hypothetical protein
VEQDLCVRKEYKRSLITHRPTSRPGWRSDG